MCALFLQRNKRKNFVFDKKKLIYFIELIIIFLSKKTVFIDFRRKYHGFKQET